MSQEIKNVLVAGAGGNLGPFILKALGKDPQYTISVLSRKGSKSQFPSHVTVYHVADDYPEDDLVPILKGQDAVISMIRPSSQKENKALINASVQAGVKRFIPGEFGSDSAPQAVRDAIPWLQNKVDLVEHLKSKEGEGLSWTSVICGSFFDWGLTSNFLSFSLPTCTATIYDAGTSPGRMTTLSTIALAVARLLSPTHYAASSNRYIYISSFFVNQNQILASLEKATGATWTKHYKSALETRKEGLRMAREGTGEEKGKGLEANLVACHFSEVEGMDYEDKELWNERLGLPVEDLDEVVEGVVKGVEEKKV